MVQTKMLHCGRKEKISNGKYIEVQQTSTVLYIAVASKNTTNLQREEKLRKGNSRTKRHIKFKSTNAQHNKKTITEKEKDSSADGVQRIGSGVRQEPPFLHCIMQAKQEDYQRDKGVLRPEMKKEFT